ncbi:MFS transporter, partial [Streptomyces bungoensis]
AKATTELQSGVAFLSDTQLKTALEEAGMSPEGVQATLSANAEARLDGLRAALATLAFAAVVALFFTHRIPTTQPRSPQA